MDERATLGVGHAGSVASDSQFENSEVGLRKNSCCSHRVQLHTRRRKLAEAPEEAREDNMTLAAILFATLIGAASGTNAAGLKFLADNKDKDGVITLASGLQYKVLRSGDGKAHPLANSPCECHCIATPIQTYLNLDEPTWLSFFSVSQTRGAPPPTIHLARFLIRRMRVAPPRRLLRTR